MNRVSTVGNYNNVLSNIMAAQKRQMEAGNQVATQKNGANLKDFSRSAEMLTAMRSMETRLKGYAEQNKMVADKLTTQDFALNQVADSAAATREAIAQALASGRADTLMQDIQGFFRNGVEGMNARYGGKYLFAGGQIDTQPVTASALSDLTAGPAISTFFKNDTYVTQAKVDDSTTVSTGMLADNLGTNLLTAFKTLQTFEEGPTGAFGGPLTAAQKTFLEGQLASWDTVNKSLIDNTARNGMIQSRLTSVKKDLGVRLDSLTGMIGDITDADMTKAATALSQAQISVQAASQVFLSLQNASLLNVLK